MKHAWTLAIVFGWLALIGPGTIEGKIWPAAAPVELTRIEIDPSDPEWVFIDGKTARLRKECNPRRLEWFRGERGGRDAPAEADWGRPIVREDGTFSFYNWRVQAAPEEVLRNETFSDVLHQCTIFGIELPWLTKSRFYR